MDIKEISAFIASNKDNDDVKTFVNSFYSQDKLNAYFATEEGKKILQPTLDQYHHKSLETWKSNNLASLVESEISKRYPAETEEQKRLKKIENELNEQKLLANREKLKNTAITKLNEAKLPLDFAELLSADDDESLNKRFDLIKNVWEKNLSERIKQEIKNNSREVHRDKQQKITSTEMNSLIRKQAGYGEDK